MKDDYLWDGSGETDPEIEHLEKVLGRYRYQPRPLSPALTGQLAPRRARWWPKVAVAAAIILMALAGVWIVATHRKGAQDDSRLAAGGAEQEPAQQETPKQPSNIRPESGGPPAPEPRRAVPASAIPASRAPRAKGPALASVRRPGRGVAPGEREAAPDSRAAMTASAVASVQPLMNPFVDVETARHIEQAQLFFRSFRNTSDAGDFDAEAEKRRSRALLSRNATLRRGAEARGNMPVEELLGSVEPFLLDIANLPDRPTPTEVRSIKERMQKKEIIAALQIYSAPTLSQAF